MTNVRQGGQMNSLSATTVACMLHQPVEKLPTKSEIRNAIPKNCFEHSFFSACVAVFEPPACLFKIALNIACERVPVRFWLLARDLLIVVLVVAVAVKCLRYEQLHLIDYIGWGFYAYVQGSAFTGLWVLAHECGHGAFTSSTLVNDTCGWLLHSSLLSWQVHPCPRHFRRYPALCITRPVLRSIRTRSITRRRIT